MAIATTNSYGLDFANYMGRKINATLGTDYEFIVYAFTPSTPYGVTIEARTKRDKDGNQRRTMANYTVRTLSRRRIKQVMTCFTNHLARNPL